MMHERLTIVDGAEVLARAKQFFAERVPHHAAFPEQEGPGYLVLRGQGGEEIAVAVIPMDGGVRVRVSTLFFDQAVERFLQILPVREAAA